MVWMIINKRQIFIIGKHYKISRVKIFYESIGKKFHEFFSMISNFSLLEIAVLDFRSYM